MEQWATEGGEGFREQQTAHRREGWRETVSSSPSQRASRKSATDLKCFRDRHFLEVSWTKDIAGTRITKNKIQINLGSELEKLSCSLCNGSRLYFQVEREAQGWGWQWGGGKNAAGPGENQQMISKPFSVLFSLVLL